MYQHTQGLQSQSPNKPRQNIKNVQSFSAHQGATALQAQLIQQQMNRSIQSRCKLANFLSMNSSSFSLASSNRHIQIVKNGSIDNSMAGVAAQDMTMLQNVINNAQQMADGRTVQQQQQQEHAKNLQRAQLEQQQQMILQNQANQQQQAQQKMGGGSQGTTTVQPVNITTNVFNIDPIIGSPQM